MNIFRSLCCWILSLFSWRSQPEPQPKPKPQPEDEFLIEYLATECELLELPVPRNQVDYPLISYKVWNKATNKLELPGCKEIKRTSKEIIKILTNGDIIAIKRTSKPLPRSNGWPYRIKPLSSNPLARKIVG